MKSVFVLVSALLFSVLVAGAPASASGPPSNDKVANAINLPSIPASVTANLQNATWEPGEKCGDELDRSVWYKVTPQKSAFLEFRPQPNHGNFLDLGLAVYTGTAGALTSLGCSYQSDLSPYGVSVDADVTAGTTYYIQVFGSFNNANPADVTLTVRARTHPYPVVDQNGTLRIRDSFTSGIATSAVAYGAASDTPVFGDWNGDGTSTVGRVHGNQWLLRNTNTSGAANYIFRFGDASDIKLVGDWDGNGTFTPGVYRNGTFYLRNSNTTGKADETIPYGRSTDIPVVGDWDNNGQTEIGLFRDGLWIIPSSDDPYLTWRFGEKGDRPIVGDWDHDGFDSAGVVRGNTWYLRNELTSGVADKSFNYGSHCDHALTLTQALTRAGCDA